MFAAVHDVSSSPQPCIRFWPSPEYGEHFARNVYAGRARNVCAGRDKKKKRKKTKNDEKRKNEEIWLHTQNPRRFPGFPVVVVTLFVEILDDFHDSVSECVTIPKKINNPFWGLTVQRKSDNFSMDVKQNTHFTDENLPRHAGVVVVPSLRRPASRCRGSWQPPAGAQLHCTPV